MPHKCKYCVYYREDRGHFCVNGWSRDGSTGECLAEPRPVPRKAEDPACRHFEEIR